MAMTERNYGSDSLVKSQKRVDDHGEVFTPQWLVESMLDLTGEPERIEARFFEPTCGNGNFLVMILERKLAIVELVSTKRIQKLHFSLIAIMSIYGVELLEDNVAECRKRLLSIFADYLNIKPSESIYKAAAHILSLNIIHGDALRMSTNNNRPIIFAEWAYLGRDRFSRQDFRFDSLVEAGDSNKAITPVKVYGPLSIDDIANRCKSSVREKSL